MRRTILTIATVAFAVLATAAVAQAYPGQRHDRHHDRHHDRIVDRAVEVHWGNAWWDAEVLEARGDRYLITYTGWSSSWDEWVGPERIRTRGESLTPASNHGRVRSVQILWGGSWYPGAVLDRRGDRYLVTYDGYSASWNEWVGPDRLRFTEAPREQRPHRAPPQRRWSRR